MERTGLLHKSEIANGYVDRVEKFLPKGQAGVGKVLEVEGDHISLSMKAPQGKFRELPPDCIRRSNHLIRMGGDWGAPLEWRRKNEMGDDGRAGGARCRR